MSFGENEHTVNHKIFPVTRKMSNKMSTHLSVNAKKNWAFNLGAYGEF